MEKSELKKILKPLIKSCIKEVLMEQGLLSVISESRRELSLEDMDMGLGQREPQHIAKTSQKSQISENNSTNLEKRKKLEENHKRMMQEIGNSGYLNNGFNPFLNTSAIGDAGAAETQDSVNESVNPKNVPPVFNNIDPNDPGVDIRGLMNMGNNRAWKAIIGKGK